MITAAYHSYRSKMDDNDNLKVENSKCTVCCTILYYKQSCIILVEDRLG